MVDFSNKQDYSQEDDPNLFKKNFSELIHLTKDHCPEDYEVIEFKLFLEGLFPGHDLYIASPIQDIEKKLEKKYGSSQEDKLKLVGIKKEIPYLELKYYQDKIGINGPRHSLENDPVIVLQYNNVKLLWNGYHRSSIRMINGEKVANCFFIKLE